MTFAVKGRRKMSRLIDADKLKEDVLSWGNCYNGYSDAYDKAMIIDEIDEQPTVDTERHGHWMKENEEDTLFRLCVYKCSLCGGEVLSEAYLFKYCPYCGAKMDEVEE